MAEILALSHPRQFAREGTRKDIPVWLWPNLLALDAPLVALVWQDYLARHFALSLHPAGRAVLALTVWAIYLADHLIDVQQAPAQAERERHAFCRRHIREMRAALALILGVDFLVACSWVKPLVFEYGILVSAGVVLYFAAFPLRGSGSAARKKPVAAVLFTAGIFLVPWVGTSHPAATLAASAAAFFALCLANLLMVESWEQSRELNSAWLAMSMLAICSLWWFWPACVSAAALAALSLGGTKLSTQSRCMLADLVLLSPLLFR
ncbi:MAG TPA: hypothetical protein VG273_08665 [Bryobacteraceae bacterium]|jgi:hypothetical protein|nr:hypothetical protein [Bryobacteraceae bacterium]